MAKDQPLAVDPIAEAKRQWIAHGWVSSATGMSTVTSIMRAQQVMLGRVERALAPFELSFARFELLRLLAFSRDGQMPQSSVIARLQVHPASVTHTVRRLVRDGLVQREPHPQDGRAALLLLTERGRDLVERATVDLNAVFADPALAEPEMVSLVRTLARFRQGEGDFAEPVDFPEPL
ncbi:MarR family winged helix-turn-helix transcriptional regulator [Microbacterium sp. NPDC058062]|uniref:MarR family winged helix-turn-helix transcriptional regulator n=1 Tax=Microbacterium sp. NPDC058062 TaxID=3346320 RepID=UPI0036DD746B